MLVNGGLKSIGLALGPGVNGILNSLEITAASGTAGITLDNRATLGWGNSSTNFTIDGSANVQLNSTATAAGLIIVNTTTGFNALTFSNAGARLKLSSGGTTDYLFSNGSVSVVAAGSFQIQGSLGLFVDSGLFQAISNAVPAFMTGNVADGASAIGIKLGNANALANASALALRVYSDSGTTSVLDVTAVGGKQVWQTTDSSGTPGAATINKASGRSAIAAAASSVVITNSVVSAASKVFISPLSRDTTGLLPTVTTRGAGSFTVTTSANCTSALSFDWIVIG